MVRLGNERVKKCMSFSLLVAARKETWILHDPHNDGGPAVVLGCRIADNLSHGWKIIVLQLSAESVRHQLFCNGARKLLRIVEQQRSQSSKTVNFLSGNCH